ncbi:HVO_0234 family beta-propeller protein [Halorubrum pallidum]
MAPAEDDISIEEKRVYAGNAERTDAYVATATGVVRVAFSADKIGAFDMVARESAADVAVLLREDAPTLLGVASPEGLRVSPVGDEIDFDTVTDESAVALGVDESALGGDDAFLVAAADGGIDRVAVEVPADAGAGDGGSDAAVTATATRIGEVPEPRAIDGPLVAAADGVYRVTGDSAAAGYSLASVGLDDARDVAGTGMPLAATAAGLYWLGNGWMTVETGDATAVAADGDGHATAVVDGDLLVRDRGDSDADGSRGSAGSAEGDSWDRDAWHEAALPVDEEAVELGYGPGVAVAVTAAGTLCVDAGDGWRHQVIGVRDAAGVALAIRE